MRATAAVLVRPKEPLQLLEREVPLPRAGEVTLRIEACGLGLGDWHVAMLDALPFTPLTLGQEAVGRIEHVGEGVTLKVGARVGLSPLSSSCGKCAHCDARCDAATWHGFSASGALTTRGNFAAQHLLALPDGSDAAELAVLMGSGWAAQSAVHALAPRAGEALGIFGLGGVGHLALQLLAGHDVAVFEPDLARRALSAAPTGATNLDAALVCVPSAQALQQAFAALAPGGRLVVSAESPTGRLDLPLRGLVGRGISIMGIGFGALERRDEALAAYTRGALKPLVARRSLADAPAVLYALRDGGHVGRIVFCMPD